MSGKVSFFDDRLQRIGGSASHVRRHVGVYPEGKAGVIVSEPFGDGLNIRSGTEQFDGEGVAEVVNHVSFEVVPVGHPPEFVFDALV